MTKKSNDLKEGGKKMKLSKGICLLAIALIVLLAFPVQGLAKINKKDINNKNKDINKWYASKDGAVEVRFISWEADVYPDYKLKLQFRLDHSQESDVWIYTFDIGEDLMVNGRRISATSSGDFCGFSRVSGTTFCVQLNCRKGVTPFIKSVYVDMAEVFPNDFINMNAYYAAQCLKGLEKMLLDPTDYAFSSFDMYLSKKYSNTVYFKFTLTAPNSLGGKTTEKVFANYNTADGTVYVFFPNTLKFKVYGGNNYVPYLQMLGELETLPLEEIILTSSIKNYLY